MFTFHLGPLSRRARMILGLIAGCMGLCVLVGPTLFALANAPPISAATSWTPLRLLPFKAFRNLADGSCFDHPPVHAGPVAVQGTVREKGELVQRITAAVFACAADGWTGDVTISAAIDARGTITDVHAAGTVSPVMRRCLRAKVIDGDPISTAGPGTLHASYFVPAGHGIPERFPG